MDDYSGAWGNPSVYHYHEWHIDGPLPLLSAIKDIVDLCLLIILITWIILWTYLIYRKHRWEQWLWKRFFKRNFIYILILFILWLGCSFLFWYLHWPFANPQTISFEN